MKRSEFAARFLIIYVAGALGAVGASGKLTAPFAVLSIVLTAELMARRAGNTGVDSIARVAGGAMVALVLGGLALNLFPEGLTRRSWSAFWVVISSLVLFWRRNSATNYSWLRARPTSQTAWFAGSAIVVAAAFIVATVGTNNDLHRPLQMWVQGKSPGSITVAVSSGSTGGPYRLAVEPQVTKTDAFDPFTVTADKAVERSLPAGGDTRYNISLVDVSTGEKVRTVIVDSPPLPASKS